LQRHFIEKAEGKTKVEDEKPKADKHSGKKK